jgi:hypothetical protein
VQDREQEGGGLAAAGFSAGEYVLAAERRGDRGDLNRRRFGEAEIGDALQESGMKL